jgi:hypothetical protein
MLATMPEDAPLEIPENNLEMPDLPSRETLAGYLGKMLVARGLGLPKHGEPWHLVQVTEPTETGSVNEDPIMAFEVLFLAPGERDDSTYIFTNEDNEMVGAMYCTSWTSPTGAPCMRSMFSSIVEEPEEELDNEAIPEG